MTAQGARGEVLQVTPMNSSSDDEKEHKESFVMSKRDSSPSEPSSTNNRYGRGSSRRNKLASSPAKRNMRSKRGDMTIRVASPAHPDNEK